MPAPPNTIRTRRWRTFREAFIATTPPYCHICGEHIDITLSGRNKRGPTIDHLVPRSHGGNIYDRGNCALAHASCNSARRNDTLTPTQSRDW